jgi:hypothetical protein
MYMDRIRTYIYNRYDSNKWKDAKGTRVHKHYSELSNQMLKQEATGQLTTLSIQFKTLVFNAINPAFSAHDNHE